MSGAIDKVEANHVRAGARAHFVDRARRLIHAPVAFSRDVLRGYVDGAARKRVHLGDASGVGTATHAITLQGTSETGSAVFSRVDIDLGFGQPFAIRDVLGR